MQETIVNTEQFIMETEKISRQRFALNRGGWPANVIELGAPIFDDKGQVIAVIGMSVATARAQLDELTTLFSTQVKYAEPIPLAMACPEKLWTTAGRSHPLTFSVCAHGKGDQR